MSTISQKIHNYNYAPGIATYGATGKTGVAGSDGCSLFFTNISLIDINELKILVNQIINNYLPIKNSDTLVNRMYQNGDCFFTLDGLIYTLYDIETLKKSTLSSIKKYSEYFKLVGRITVDTASYMNFLKGGQRLELNTKYNGFDIITTETSNGEMYINKNVVMNIISDNLDSYNNINLLLLSAVNLNNIVDGQFLIYFDTNDNAFHITSNDNVPIIINSDIKINLTSIEKELDGYSSVLTSADPITVYKSICSNINYRVSNNSTDDSCVSLSIVLNQNADKYNLIKLKFNSIVNYMFVKIYANGMIFTSKLEDAEKTIADESMVFTLLLNQYITDCLLVQAVSLLYNTEIFINKI